MREVGVVHVNPDCREGVICADAIVDDVRDVPPTTKRGLDPHSSERFADGDVAEDN